MSGYIMCSVAKLVLSYAVMRQELFGMCLTVQETFLRSSHCLCSFQISGLIFLLIEVYDFLFLHPTFSDLAPLV